MMFKTFKIFLILIIFSITNPSFSQITRITYKNNLYNGDISKVKISDEIKKNLDASQIKLLESFMISESLIEFELIFDKNESVYKRIENLESDDQKLDRVNLAINSTKYYKNISERLKFHQTKSPELLNVSNPFEMNWEITTETKIISGFKCYKATATIQDIYNPIKKVTNVSHPVVWFTPDIAASFGPKGLDGLPGLVLEATFNGKKYLLATNIDLDYKGVKSVEKPKGGKDVTEKELETILIDNYNKH